VQLDGLFIDMYGTLTAGDRAAVESVCAALLRDTGLRRTPRDLGILWGERFFAALHAASGDGFRTLFAVETATLVETLAALDVQIDPAPYIAQLVAYWRNPPLQPEVPDFVARCRLPLVIVSNADRADLACALASHSLAPADVVTSEDARAYKPDPRIFELALARTGWRRDRVLHVGDSLHSDIGGAQAAGLRNAWLNRAHRIHDIGTHAPDFECADLHALLTVLA
jgi:HAD superfamily hydrolase (TIGR01509 family)